VFDDVRSPKLRGRSAWYPYYAAFDPSFVDDVLGALDVGDGPVLDPWNGSGTTTYRAHRAGLSAIGFDLNPACVVVANARLLTREVNASLLPLARDLIEHGHDIAASDLAGVEPLELWFDPKTALRIRSMEMAIRSRLSETPGPGGPVALANAMSSLAAFYYVALFAVVRELTASFRTTNPTWVKTTGPKVKADWRTLASEFRNAVRAFASKSESAPTNSAAATVSVADAARLPLGDGSVGAVFSSPPYATRIDYVVATRPELAVLGVGSGEPETSLRRSMLGTTKMVDKLADASTIRSRIPSPTAVLFLDTVLAHASKASSSYYARYFAQYFVGLTDSVNELSRVCRPAAPMAFVVQDSYYKEVRLDLPTIVTELFATTGRTLVTEKSFSTGTRASINPNSRKYRSSFRAAESLIVGTAP
jgi:hypothetical protein